MAVSSRAPGGCETLTVTFDESALYEVIVCTLEGHYETGMYAPLTGLEQ